MQGTTPEGLCLLSIANWPLALPIVMSLIELMATNLYI